MGQNLNTIKNPSAEALETNLLRTLKKEQCNF